MLQTFSTYSQIVFARLLGAYYRTVSAVSAASLGCMLCSTNAASQTPSATTAIAKRLACTDATWSEPRILKTKLGQPIYVEAPVAMPFRGGIALLGTPSVIWKSGNLFADSSSSLPGGGLDAAGVILGPTFDATAVPLPPNVTQMRNPRGVTATDGSLHVIWGSSPDSSRRSSTETELWYSRFDGNKWRATERILQADDIWWNTEWQSIAAVESEPRVSVAVANSKQSPPRTGALFLRGPEARWTSSWLTSYPGLPPYNTVIADELNGGAVMAFVGSVFRRGENSDMNGLFVSRSMGVADNWTTPSRIDSFGSNRGHGLQLLRAGPDTIHLFWLVDSLPSARTGSIEHTVSSDRGKSWERRPSFQLNEPMEALSAVLLGQGIHAIVRSRQTRLLSHVWWTTPSRVAIRQLPFKAAQSVPRLNLIGRDSALLNWGVGLPNSYPLAPRMPSPAMQMAILAATCR